MIYRSKKAWWSAFLFVGPSLVCMIGGVVVIYAGIVAPMSPLPESARVELTIRSVVAIVGVVMIVIGAILLWSYISWAYEITPTQLIVRIGPFRLRYPLDSIAEAIPTLVPAGTAVNLSTSRATVCIKFRVWDGYVHGGPLAISPANKAEFLRELAERAPRLGGHGESGQGRTTRLEPGECLT